MESFSAELIELIFRQLDVLSLVNSSSVCRQWINYTTNWRVWQSFYFQRWPFHKDDITYKKSVGDQWKSLYIQMHTYSRDVLCLETLSLRKSVQAFMEEVLISPYVTNKHSLYCGTAESSYFKVMSDRLFCSTEDKNELFNTFIYDIEFLSYYYQPNFKEEFSKVVAAAKAKNKKTLLLVPDLGSTPHGTNPILSNPMLANDFIQTVNKYRDDIILMLHSAQPFLITNAFIKLFASYKMNLVHVKLPDKEERIELLSELTKEKQTGEDEETSYFDIDFNFLVEKFEGVNEGTIHEVINRTFKKAITRALQQHSKNENEPIHVVATMEDFMEEFNNNSRLPMCRIWDRDNYTTLQNMVNTYPEDLKLMSI